MRLAILAAGLGLAQSAGGEPKSAANPAETAKSNVERKLGPAPDKATTAKVGAYIEIINEESEKFNRERQDWLSRINPKTGPTCKENVAIGQTIGPDGGRFDAYRKKLKAKPALPPDSAALQMVEAVEELRNIGKEPGPYNEYQGKSKPGSWCKKLKETYPRLVTIFDKFHRAEREVRAYVDTFTDERDLREIQTTSKKYGKRYRYQFAVLVFEGKMMMRTVGAELRNDSPDAALIKNRFDSFFAVADETKAMMDKEPPKQKTDPYPNAFSFFLIESVPKIKRTSATLLETLGKRTVKDWNERVRRDWNAVVGAYNDMVDYENQVQFEAKQK
jgi:hypothetical protein